MSEDGISVTPSIVWLPDSNGMAGDWSRVTNRAGSLPCFTSNTALDLTVDSIAEGQGLLTDAPFIDFDMVYDWPTTLGVAKIQQINDSPPSASAPAVASFLPRYLYVLVRTGANQRSDQTRLLRIAHIKYTSDCDF